MSRNWVYGQTLLSGISEAARWLHLSDIAANRRTDPIIVVYASRIEWFIQHLRNQGVRILNDMMDSYGDIEMGPQAWDDNFEPRLIDFDSAQVHVGDYALHMHVRNWMSLAEHGPVGGHTLSMENCPEISGPEQPEEDHGNIFEGMYVAGCGSLNQARLAEDQVEGLRRKAKSSSSDTPGCIRNGRRPGYSFGARYQESCPGRLGMTAAEFRCLRCCHPPTGARSRICHYYCYYYVSPSISESRIMWSCQCENQHGLVESG
jgi:hypothetical protein